MRRFLNPLVLNIQKMELELTCPVWYTIPPPPPVPSSYLYSLDLDVFQKREQHLYVGSD